jgi:FAD/FMN-containing dehydrogenase
MDTTALALQALMSRGQVLTGPSLPARYRLDTADSQGKTPTVVAPADEHDLRRVLDYCNRNGVGVVPYGGGTSLVQGVTPGIKAIVLTLHQFNQLEVLDPRAGRVRVGAGVPLERLAQTARRLGRSLGFHMPSLATATVGGAISTNAAGAQALRHGRFPKRVVAAQCCLANGKIVGPGSLDSSRESVFPWLVGSEGTIAVVTAADVEFVPRFTHRSVALIAFPDVVSAVTASLLIESADLPLEALEFMTGAGVRLVAEQEEIAQPFSTIYPAYLLIELDGDRPQHETMLSLIDDLTVERALAYDAVIAEDDHDAARLWRLLWCHSSTIDMLGVTAKFDIAVPSQSYAAFLREAAALVALISPGARFFPVGHIGRRYNVQANWVLGQEADYSLVEVAVLGLAARHGGSIADEHGYGRAKTRFLHPAGDQEARKKLSELTMLDLADRGLDDPALATQMMQAVAALSRPHRVMGVSYAEALAAKRLFDPMGIFSPGVIFPAKVPR